jgi:predicted GNAT family acetyltransferase
MIKTIITSNEIHAVEDDKLVGKIEFSLSNNDMTILHTYAYESGRGIGSLLMKEAVRWAKINHYPINPICSFAKKHLEHNSYT